ncbi:MAG: hypothetical protein AAF567_05855 [Actinomycetota bacterium]
MQLADAIRAWGRTHRRELDERELEQLGTMYRRVRDTGHGTLDITTMTKDHARSVMLEFDKAERAHTAAQLNTVRKWAIAQAAQPAEPAEAPQDASVKPAPRNPMAQETTVLRAPIDDLPPVPAPPVPTGSPGASSSAPADIVEIDPAALAPSVGGPSAVATGGPVQGWQPPDQPIDTGQLDRRALALIGVAVVIVLVLIWLVFLRDDSSDTVPVNATVPTVVEDPGLVVPVPETDTTTDSSTTDLPSTSTDVDAIISDGITEANAFFLAEFGVADELGQCLINELGELAVAATDAEQLSRSVCGTSLIEVIANGR